MAKKKTTIKPSETANGLKYLIQVPSRYRPQNMNRLFSLLPDAHVYIRRDQFADYESEVPAGHLHVHPDFATLTEKKNYMLDEAAKVADCAVHCDDDFEGFWRLVGKQRLVTDSETIRALIENQAHVCDDLSLGVFCWSRTRRQMKRADPAYKTIHFVFPAMGIVGFMNDALHKRRFDLEVTGRADIDHTLTTLLEDRILLCDLRFYGEFGPIRSAPNQTAKQAAVIQEKLLKRWAASFKLRDAGDQNRSAVSTLINVKRTQKV